MYRHHMTRMLRLAIGGLAAAATLAVAACGAGGGAAKSSPLGAIDQATRTVQVNLILTGSGFNGYSNGQITVRVPRGWKVDVYCGNETATPHSCAIVAGARSRHPAFSGAACPHPVRGVPADRSANFSFIAGAVGSYRVESLVRGHEDPGRWDRFDVVAAGTPSVSTQPGPATELRSA